jgi:hypothetical protein
MNDLTQYLCESVEETFANRVNLWQDSPFQKLTLLTNDERGKWGEKTIKHLIETYTDYSVDWFGDKNINQSDGTYDIIVKTSNNNYRVEIKTATRGNSKNPNWQHENLIKDEQWDKIVFLDVDLFGIYISIINFDEIDFNIKHPIFGRTPTLRKNQDDKYKFDFGKKQQDCGIEYGLSFFFDIRTDDTSPLRDFLSHRFS